MALPIEDYALIGDTQTAALVGRDGSIDWLCLPRFDSPACFAALLGDRRNGRWRIAPKGGVRRAERRYREDTLILETEFHTEDGVVRVVDCMPPRGEAPDVVRLVQGVKGRVEVEMELVIRFDYGHVVPWTRRHGDYLLAVAGPDALRLDTPVETRRRELHDAGVVRRVGGRRGAVRAHVVRVARAGAGARPGGRRGRRHRAVVPGVDRQVRSRRPAGAALAAHAEGADLRADRRHRRRADDVAAREARRRAQLGLPVLLGARRHARTRRDAQRRLRRGGRRVARLAAARRRGGPARHADHVRLRRRTPPHGARARLADAATRAPGRCASGTPHRSSSSSTCTAS